MDSAAAAVVAGLRGLPGAGNGSGEAGGGREKSVHELLYELYGRLGSITGLSVFPILPASLPTAGQFDVEYVLRANDTPENMKMFADKIIDKALASGNFMFVNTDLKIDLPQAELQIDDKGSGLGVVDQRQDRS